jgi:hypothetical protein
LKARSDKIWFGGTADGSTPGNWSPTTSFNAVINGGTAQVTTTNNNTARTLQIGQDSGSNGTVDIIGGVLSSSITSFTTVMPLTNAIGFNGIGTLHVNLQLLLLMRLLKTAANSFIVFAWPFLVHG